MTKRTLTLLSILIATLSASIIVSCSTSSSPPILPALTPNVKTLGDELKAEAKTGLNANEKTAKAAASIGTEFPETQPKVDVVLSHNKEQNESFHKIAALTLKIGEAQSQITTLGKTVDSLRKRNADLEQESGRRLANLKALTYWICGISLGVFGILAVTGRMNTALPAFIAAGAIAGMMFLDFVMEYSAWIAGAVLVVSVGAIARELWIKNRGVKEIVKTVDETFAELGKGETYRVFAAKAHDIQKGVTPSLVDIAQGRAGWQKKIKDWWKVDKGMLWNR
jgi:hypothetical protein